MLTSVCCDKAVHTYILECPEHGAFPTEGSEVEKLKDKLKVAREAIEYIGCRTDHGDQEPCDICRTVDEALKQIGETDEIAPQKEGE